jgi:TRAP-type C4-dicarboxylate transport system permease small subunit
MQRFIDALSVLIGGVLVVYSVFVCVEIIGRRFFGFSFQGVDEVGGYLMATMVAVGLSCALYSHAHIRIDILLKYLPRALAMWLNVVTLAALSVLALFLFSRALFVLSDSYALQSVSSTPLLTPLVIPQSIWAGGLLIFVIASLNYFIRSLRHGLQGEAEKVAALLGLSGGSE